MAFRSGAAVGCALSLAAAALSACSVLPSAAPTAVEFIAPGALTGDPGYVLLDLDPTVAKAISSFHRAGLSSLGADVYKPSLVLKPGDVIAVTVFEVAQIPLFGAAPALSGSADKSTPVGGHTATLPAQVVEQDGTVPVPFGGTVKVAGFTPAQAGRAIGRSLDGKATNPQVLVSLLSSTINTASVNGDVGKPGLVPITVRGERVLDVIAEAGGPKDPPFDTDVQLVRRSRVARAKMQRLIDDPRENIRMEPGDNLVLIHNPRSFSVLGAALKVSQYDFNVERVTLAEGVARAGGGNDAVANVGQIFLMRFEPQVLVKALLPAGDPRRTALEAKPDPVPVIYHLDLRAASGYFISQQVQLRDKDTVLITNADAVELAKAVQIMRGIAGIYYDFRGPVTTTSAAGRTTVTTTSEGGEAIERLRRGDAVIPPRRTHVNRGPMAGQRRRTRLFQSLRLGGFWSKLQAPFRFASLLLWPWLKARMSLRALDLVMGSPTAPAGRGCVVVAAHHGDHGLARAFLVHHRGLGATHFVFLDLSVDGGLAAFLGAEPGCTVWRPRAGMEGGRALDWLNGLRGRYATGRWCLSLSTTDLFVFYRCESRGLADFTDFLDTEARDHAYALVVEMYGERPAAELAAEGAVPSALDRFDAFGFVTLDPGRFRNVIVRGGLQRRTLHRTKPRRSPALNRVPLVKWQWFYGYMAGTRLIVPAYLNSPHTRWHSSPTGCILRYALLAGPETLAVAARHEAAVTVKDGGLAAYPGLLKLRDTAPLQDASRRYRTTRDLVEAGLLNPGQWF